MNAPGTAMVIGGGLAGISAALHLSDAGVHVTLLESSQRLGGRATSFRDPGSDTLIDNCQHVLLGSCTNLVTLYRRLGVEHLIRWDRTLYFAAAGGHISPLRVGSMLPAPLHLTGPFLSLGSYSIAEKTMIAVGMSRIMAARFDEPEWAQSTFEQWLRRHDQSDRVIRRFWNVIITSACNLGADRVAARHGLQVFQQGFLQHRRSFELGVPTVPLLKLYDPAMDALDDVRLGQRVVAIDVDEERVTNVELQTGERLSADAVVLALPGERLPDLFDSTARDRDERIENAARLGTSPILGVHLVFDQSVTDLPHIAMLEHDTDWFFVREQGRWVHAVISAADTWMSMPADVIIERVMRDLREVCPAARGVEPAQTHVVKSRRATFAATPETETLRPDATGAIENLFLAGDYCRSGWPATMEGAVRSGSIAAARTLGLDATTLIVDDLAASVVYRFLSCCASCTP